MVSFLLENGGGGGIVFVVLYRFIGTSNGRYAWDICMCCMSLAL